ncbi:hypothetical protein, partial [Yersinia enterocolitica]|uniref:hypothetical protein n=3 Tax=Yersinia enterocolitica TaxID=630 RepID=UPI00092F4C2B
ISSWFGRNRAHKETGYMAAIPERYFQEKTLGLLGASIYGAALAYKNACFNKRSTASLLSACFHRYGRFIINLKLTLLGITDSYIRKWHFLLLNRIFW